jgi:hypothetical protein
MDSYSADDNNALATPAGAKLTAEQERFLMGEPFEYDDQRIMHELVDQAQAAPIEEAHLELHLRAASGVRVTVTNIRPIEIVRAPALSGTLLYLEKGTDYSEPQYGEITFDFNETWPLARSLADASQRGVPIPPYFPRRKFQITGEPTDPSESSVKELTIHSYLYNNASSVTFKIDVEYQIGRSVRHQVIDDWGRPFRLTGLNCIRPGYASYQLAHINRGEYKRGPIDTPGPAPDPRALHLAECEPPNHW